MLLCAGPEGKQGQAWGARGLRWSLGKQDLGNWEQPEETSSPARADRAVELLSSQTRPRTDL